MTTAAIVLAAGEGSRFRADGGPGVDGGRGPHKLTAPFRGRPLVTWSLTAALDGGLAAVYVVTGAVDLGEVPGEVLGGVLAEGLGDVRAESPGDVLIDPDRAAGGVTPVVIIVDNARWAEGQASSLAAGVAAAEADGHDAVVVGLGDQPLIEAEAWRRVAALVGPDHPIVAATYDGRRRNPVGLHRSVWAELPDHGDAGARVLMAGRPELVTEVACPGEPVDVDTQEDLTRWS